MTTCNIAAYDDDRHADSVIDLTWRALTNIDILPTMTTSAINDKVIMARTDISRIADALERIADALEAGAKLSSRPRQARSVESHSTYTTYLEALTDKSDQLVGDMTMDEILDVIGADRFDAGARRSVGFALSRLGVRKGRSATRRFYVFSDSQG